MKSMYFVKSVKRGYVAWQDYQSAESAEQAIEFAKIYNPRSGATWTAELA